MELYKIIKEKMQKYNGGFVVIDNMIHTNPTEDIVKKAGYKPKIEDEQPEYNIETQYLERVVEDTEDAILVHWEVKELEIPEDVETEDTV